MGPFQEYEEKKSPEKGSPRSRIPRLIVHPFRPKDQGSPLSDSPFSEEEGKECDSDHSKGTASTNGFCSDDTGCPPSQSVSPSKTPPGSDRGALGSPVPPERKTKVKRVRMVTERNGEARSTQRHKRELRSALKTRGSEADFSSSSSSSASLKSRDRFTASAGEKTTSTRSRVTRIRPLPVFKSPGSPTPPPRGSLRRSPPAFTYSSSCTATTSSSSCHSSPTSRTASLSRFLSCGDNHGIRPPNPEQYLTPLQQKEVAIRHLKTKLLESEGRVRDRETEIGELKSQLCRMREDWIEEECHRVEAQLSLKEARKEIKQLRQVVETMKNSLMEKDKGIQKYFIDINIQNRKLESLLHSMELAQSGANLPEESAVDFICDSGRKMTREEEEEGEELGAEALADSGLLANDEMANRADIFEQVFMSTAVDFSQDSSDQPGEAEEEERASGGSSPPPPLLLLSNSLSCISPCQHTIEEKGVQTDHTPPSPDLQALLLQLLKFHGCSPEDTALPQSDVSDLPPRKSVAPPETPDGSDSGCWSEATESRRFMEELDFDEPAPTPEAGAVSKRYWSSSFLLDLVAVAAPVLPTVAWLYSRHGVDGGGAPVYNIAALIRGCCAVGLHSLRHAADRRGGQ